MSINDCSIDYSNVYVNDWIDWANQSRSTSTKIWTCVSLDSMLNMWTWRSSSKWKQVNYSISIWLHINFLKTRSLCCLIVIVEIFFENEKEIKEKRMLVILVRRIEFSENIILSHDLHLQTFFSFPSWYWRSNENVWFN